MNLEEFYGARVRIVLTLLRNGAMTQTALVRELRMNARVMKRHLGWLVRNGIVKKFGSVVTFYEVNTDHPIIKTIQQLMQMSDTRAPRQ